MKVRLLVGHNTAGALTPVVDWIVEQGHSGKILASKQSDIFELTSCSDNAIMTEGRTFYEIALNLILDRYPTVIQVNSTYIVLSFIRLFAPRTPLIYMYHGSEIRERWKVGLGDRMEAELADKIIVSTPDLQRAGEWFDRAIPEYFTYRGGRQKGTALMVYADFFADCGKDQRELAKEVCNNLGLELDIREKRNTKPIPNIEMPTFYSRYEYFLDFKGHDVPETFALSKSAIEAMMCGCHILHDINPYEVLEPSKFLNDETLYYKYLELYQTIKPISYLGVVPRLMKTIISILMTPKISGYRGVSTRVTSNGIKRLGYYFMIFIKVVLQRSRNRLSYTIGLHDWEDCSVIGSYEPAQRRCTRCGRTEMSDRMLGWNVLKKEFWRK